MAPKSARHAILSEIATFDAESKDLRIVIETPKGSRNKYSYDPACDCLELSTVLPEGMVFPYDFGFIPSTLGDDGDPLDILVLMEAPVVPGCVIRARLIGAIEAKQKEKDAGWTSAARLAAIPACQRRSKNASVSRSKNTSVMLAKRPPNWEPFCQASSLGGIVLRRFRTGSA